MTKIAVTYDHGQIWQHFGKTEFFKIYTVDEGRLTGTRVVSTGGLGHGALAGFLADQNVRTPCTAAVTITNKDWEGSSAGDRG